MVLLAWQWACHVLPAMKWLNNRYILCRMCTAWLLHTVYTYKTAKAQSHFRFYVAYSMRAESSRHQHQHHYHHHHSTHGSSIISFTMVKILCMFMCKILAYRYWPHYIRSDHKFVCMSVWFNRRKPAIVVCIALPISLSPNEKHTQIEIVHTFLFGAMQWSILCRFQFSFEARETNK